MGVNLLVPWGKRDWVDILLRADGSVSKLQIEWGWSCWRNILPHPFQQCCSSLPQFELWTQSLAWKGKSVEVTSWNLSSTWWRYGNFPLIVVFVQVIVWPRFFYIMFFWLLFSSQKHDYSIVIPAYVQLCNPKWYCMFLMLSQLNHGKRYQWQFKKKKSERMASNLILVKRRISFYKWLFIIKKKKNEITSPKFSSFTKSARCFEAVGKILSCLFFGTLFPMFGKLSSLISILLDAERNDIGQHWYIGSVTIYASIRVMAKCEFEGIIFVLFFTS